MSAHEEVPSPAVYPLQLGAILRIEQMETVNEIAPAMAMAMAMAMMTALLLMTSMTVLRSPLPLLR